MPYDIPRPSGYRIQPFKLQDDETLIATMAQQLLKARLAQARAAARGGGGGGRSGGKGKGAWVWKLNEETGRYERTWMEGSTEKERKINARAMDFNKAKDRLDQSPEVAKLLGVLRNPGASNLTKREALKQVNALRSDPGLADLDKDAVGEALARTTKPYAAEVQEEKRKIDSSGRLGALGTSAKIAYEKFDTWLDELIHGADAPEVIEGTKRSQERQRVLRESDPYLHEQDLREAEEPEKQRGVLGRVGGDSGVFGTVANLATNAGSTLVSDPGLGVATAGMVIGGMASAPVSIPAAIGTALAVGGGMMSSDIAFKERLAGDPNLSDAEKARAYDEGAFAEKAVGGALNAVPALSPGFLVGRQLGKAAVGLAGREAEAAIAARAAELARPGNLMKYNVLPASGEAAALNAVQTAGSNLHYGHLTGQDVDVAEGVPQAALMGAGFGVAAGAGGIARGMLARRPASAPASPDGEAPQPSGGAGISREDLADLYSQMQAQNSKGSKGSKSAKGGSGGNPPAPPAAAAPAPQTPVPPPPVAPAAAAPASAAPAASAASAPVAPSAASTASAPASPASPAPAAPQAPSAASAPSAPAAPAQAPRTSRDRLGDVVRHTPNMDTAHHNALREKWLANDPQLREAVEGMLGSTGKEYDAWQSRADALLRRHYEEDADEILNDPGVKAALAKEAQIREAAPAGKKPKTPKPLKGRSLQSRMTKETQNIRDYAQGRLPAPEAPDRMESPVAMPRANQSSVGRSTPSSWPLNRVRLEDMQARVAAERAARAARQPAPQAAAASLEQAGVAPGRPMTRDDLVRELTNARSSGAKPAEAKSSKSSKTFSPDTTLSKDDLGFLRTAAAKSDEAMDTLLQKRPELATQEGADEIMRVLDQALNAQRAGNGTKSLSNLIAGSARTLKYLQEVRNITPEVANDARRVDAVRADSPVQPAAAVRKRAVDTENSGADSAVAPDTGEAPAATPDGAPETPRVRGAEDQGVGDGGGAGGRPAAPEDTSGSPRAEGAGREPGGEGAVGEPNPEPAATVSQDAGEGAGGAEPPAVAVDGSPAPRRSSEEAVAELHDDYLSRMGYAVERRSLENNAQTRANAVARLAAVADDIGKSPALARRNLETLHKTFGLGKRSYIENMIRMTDDPYLKESLTKVLELFRPGETEALPPPVHVSERLSRFLEQPMERLRAVYDTLTLIPDMSSKDFQASFGKNGEKLVQGLRDVGLGTPEDLEALADVVRQRRVLDSRVEASIREDTAPSGETSMLEKLTGKAPAPAERADPFARLADGIEAAQVRMRELYKASGDQAKIVHRNYVASLPLPERMSSLFNRVPEVRMYDPGSPEWNEASASLANRILDAYRAYYDSRKGQPDFAKLEKTAKTLEDAGYSLDFFEALRPGVDMLESDYKFTAEDIRLAYDPEAVIREGLAQQAEGLDVCIR